ncbi:hypothetical protein SAY87_020784 [Trapa incisa]|uniref:Uncharacterized protein n=1 Tax=Trapa incisa TaxID=236973 RepID=A0AAN7JQW4_9MYRT|nr:hypothetical protein SAY87_020784 [Trapa incisa]
MGVCSATQSSHDKGVRNSQSTFSLGVGCSNMPSATAEISNPGLEATFPQNMSSMFSCPLIFAWEKDNEVTTVQPYYETNHDGCVADDSEGEDNLNDIYLS